MSKSFDTSLQFALNRLIFLNNNDLRDEVLLVASVITDVIVLF